MKKICSKCGVDKDVGEFYKEKLGRYGVRADCKECNSIKSKKYSNKHSDRLKEQCKKWREKNKDHVRKYDTEYKKNKYTNDPQYKLSCLVRGFTKRVTNAVKQQKELRSLEYLGCSLDEFKSHIESLWLEDMSWDNHGDWHIDHKIPLDWFVKNSDDPWKANHYSNLQPLWAEANLSKGNSL